MTAADSDDLALRARCRTRPGQDGFIAPQSIRVFGIAVLSPTYAGFSQNYFEFVMNSFRGVHNEFFLPRR